MQNLSIIQDQADQTARLNRRRILMTAISSTIIGNISLNGLNVAIPSIEKDLGMSAVLVGWVPLSMMLAMAVGAAPISRFSDIWGRRKTTILGGWVAAAGSILCALAQHPITFLISRGIMGLGLGALFITVTAMVTAAYPANQRGRVLGYTIGSVYIGLGLGPVICGYLINLWSWHAIFIFSTVVLLIPIGLSHLVKIEQIATPGEKFDYSGAVLWVLAVVGIFTGFSSITQRSGQILAGLGILVFVLFIRTALKHEKPLLDMRLFVTNRRFAFSSLAAYVIYASGTSAGFLISLYLQYIKGYSPSEAGLILMVQPVMQAVVTPLAGRLSDRVDPGILASIGIGFIGASILFLSFGLAPDTSLFRLIPIMLLFGLGFAVFSAPNSNAIISSVPAQKIGQASGVITAVRLWGQISSMALATLVFSLVIGPGKIVPAKYPLFLDAANICFKVFAPLCLVSIIASLARGGAQNPKEDS